jgi:exodeoxyribonuclease VII large subunit
LAFEFRLSALADRLSTSVRNRVQGDLSRLERYQGDIMHLSRGLLQKQSEQLRQIRERLQRELSIQMDKKGDYLALLEKRTELVDPRNILLRGYSMTLIEGKALRSIRNIKPGSLLETRLHDGSIISKVEPSSKTNDKRED